MDCDLASFFEDDFLKKSNQYQTSSLTKFLLQKKGFRVFLSTDSLPVDLLQNRCLALTAIVSDASGVLIVKNNAGNSDDVNIKDMEAFSADMANLMEIEND